MEHEKDADNIMALMIDVRAGNSETISLEELKKEI